MFNKGLFCGDGRIRTGVLLRLHNTNVSHAYLVIHN